MMRLKNCGTHTATAAAVMPDHSACPTASIRGGGAAGRPIRRDSHQVSPAGERFEPSPSRGGFKGFEEGEEGFEGGFEGRLRRGGFEGGFEGAFEGGRGLRSLLA